MPLLLLKWSLRELVSEARNDQNRSIKEDQGEALDQVFSAICDELHLPKCL
jgi:hypothetical protein